MAEEKPLIVRIRDAKNVIFDGPVDRITTINEVGPLDIYPMHANFISIIRNGLSLFKDSKVIKEMKFEQAVMKVKQDRASVFLGIEGFLLEEEKIAGSSKKKSS